MKIGIAANGNVNIQSRYTVYEDAVQVRLTCKRCQTAESIKDTAFLTRNGDVPDQVISFCASHRHEGTMFESASKALAVFGKQEQIVVKEESEGRRFREEDY
jgi:hypothetical protein